MTPFTRHRRFLIAFGTGLATAAASLLLDLPMMLRALAAADVFFIVYLGLMAHFAATAERDDLRSHAERSDEGLPVILAIALGAVILSLTAIFTLLNAAHAGALEIALALGSVPLGWTMLHTLSAFHYAYLFYAPGESGEDAGGLGFPGATEPDVFDFLYFAFVLGMTAQTSDVSLERGTFRRAVLVHSLASFVYNTVLIALVVNAALTLTG